MNKIVIEGRDNQGRFVKGHKQLALRDSNGRFVNNYKFIYKSTVGMDLLNPSRINTIYI